MTKDGTRLYFQQALGIRSAAASTSTRPRPCASGDSGATDDYESADLCVINTCAVTGEADKDALQLVRRIARRNPGARLVVTGCCAERAAAPGAILCANAGKDDLPSLLGFACGPRPARQSEREETA